MKILIIDNYDSFTFNLYQALGKIIETIPSKGKIDVIRNNEHTINEIIAEKYDRIIISPGPGNPDDPAYFGICAQVITELGPTIPILGVCLGMQGIAHCFGAQIIRAPLPMHGKTSRITHNRAGIFRDLPQGLEVMRYHSLIVNRDTLPSDLIVTATDPQTNEIMGIRHRVFPIEGVQFHPESFASEGGELLLNHFLLEVI